jgi:hypothetical protein
MVNGATVELVTVCNIATALQLKVSEAGDRLPLLFIEDRFSKWYNAM